MHSAVRTELQRESVSRRPAYPSAAPGFPHGLPVVAERKRAWKPRRPAQALASAAMIAFRNAGRSLGLASFGASAPGPVLMENLGITPEDVVAAAKRIRAQPGLKP